VRGAGSSRSPESSSQSAASIDVPSCPVSTSPPATIYTPTTPWRRSRGLRTLGPDRLHLDLPAFRGGHPRAVGAAAHESSGARTIRDEDHARGHFPLAAPERGLAVGRADPDCSPRGHAHGPHVVRMHGQGADDGLVLGIVLADVDLLTLLGRATSVHEEP